MAAIASFSQVCVLVGDLDIVAPVLTAIFCLSWGCTNLTCAILSSLGSPNFRPTFKFYSKYGNFDLFNSFWIKGFF